MPDRHEDDHSGLLFSPQPSSPSDRDFEEGLFSVARLEQRESAVTSAREKDEESSGLVNVKELIGTASSPEADDRLVIPTSSPVEEREHEPESAPSTTHQNPRRLLTAITLLALVLLGMLAFLALR